MQKFSLVEFTISPDELPELISMGLPLDCCGHSEVNRDGKMTLQVPVNEYEMQELKNKRSNFSVVIDDLSSFYAQRAAKEDIVAISNEQRGTSMKLGSMGGCYKLEEMLQTLDGLYAKYQSRGLISQKRSIGKSAKGRDIYVVKISDNANVDERNDEPGVLYTGLHHARESASLMTNIYFMHYLLENYDTDARVKNIVDSRQLYFIPMVNPDGFMMNQTSSPNGGGMQRKNANGVDLNRNYGPEEYWNYPNSGSSTSPFSETYRGPSAFSESETRAVRDFILSHDISTALNYHSYSNLMIYPLGIRNQIAHDMYRTMAIQMTKVNRYRYGTAEGLLYAVRGCSDDWFHYAQGTKKTVFAMTPEVGSSFDGFWPSPSRFFPLAEENVESNLLLAEFAAKVPR
jgi:hypothetical protein